jgi:predicted SprT family Zn-dependent metalloprotease
MVDAALHNCSCCGRELPRKRLHELGEGEAFICRRCGLWVATRWRADRVEPVG